MSIHDDLEHAARVGAQIRANSQELKKMETQAARDADLDLEQVLSTEHGRRFYYRLVMLEARLESPSFDASNASVTAYLEGTRAVGLRMKDEALRVCPELWVRMLAERLERAATAAGARDGATPADLEP